MVNKNILICIGRDGTLSYDMRDHLGHTNSWKRKIRFLDNIVQGIKKLRKIKRFISRYFYNRLWQEMLR